MGSGQGDLICPMLLPAQAVAGASGKMLFSVVEGIHICSVTATGTGLVLYIETAETDIGWPDCGVVAVRARPPAGSAS